MTVNNGSVDAAIGRMERIDERKKAEADRIAEVKARGAVPDACGPEIPVAPARGVFETFAPREMVQGSTLRMRNSGWMGRKAMRRADAFDVMAEQARRKDKDADPPFTRGQVNTGREYQALVERLECAGVRCSSLESQSRGSPGAGSFSEAMVRDGLRLDRLRRQIGDRVAISVRRVRPSKRGTIPRRGIPDRALVDMVCIAEKTLSDVLRAFGWSNSSENRKSVRTALCAALDRMQGR